ncbi:MAG: hypothetical protein E6R03_13300 [Hyphomicrobiaceae bacterium]|nr:MAG: hypothetical protein E6R03_13300 [Hyphomicrobiaceae bacterium]
MDNFEILDSQEKLPRLKRERDGFNRADVVNAFQDAFQIIGGTTRLALWANANPEKFFQLYSKLLPSQSQQFVEQTTRTIIHALPPSALDNHAGFAPPEVTIIREDREPV